MTDETYLWPPFSVAATAAGESILIEARGELDFAASPQLKDALLAAIERASPPREVRVDLSGVAFIDAGGVGVLVEAQELALRRGIAFAVQDARGVVLRVFEILGLAEMLQYSRSAPTAPASDLPPRS